jgi:riboflavin kinase/FMN adenylyltransferase
MGLELPPFGVYAARARHAGGEFPAAVNLGQRPTLQSLQPQLRFETHLIGYQGDLYGQDLTVELVGFLRPERRFAHLEALKAQIAKDIAAAEKALF